MQKTFLFKLLPSESLNDSVIKIYIAETAGVKQSAVSGYTILKRSIDARGKQPWINLSLRAFIDEPWQKRKLLPVEYGSAHTASCKVIVIGAGPAGLFSALKLIESGIKPIILERGKDVRARRRDLAILNKQGIINPESNYCFGEGGAGTYSDGKLYTRSTKRGDIDRILNLFVHFGAEENILYESHPHIGTNKLPQIITAIRKQLIASGAEILFEKKVTNLFIKGDTIAKVKTADDTTYEADAIILATGHSARDIFQLLYSKKIQVEFKPFALGVRIEHPQQIIDSIQYHCMTRSNYLPPASYSLVEQINGKGVFSFCMCPGGIIAPAATNDGELVVNGWSPSKRNNPFANSGMVVQVEMKDAMNYFRNQESKIRNPKSEIRKSDIRHQISSDPLLLMHFQKDIEQKAYEAGGGNLVAPAQRMIDFCNNKISSTLPECSYLPGVYSTDLKNVLPVF